MSFTEDISNLQSKARPTPTAMDEEARLKQEVARLKQEWKDTNENMLQAAKLGQGLIQINNDLQKEMEEKTQEHSKKIEVSGMLDFWFLVPNSPKHFRCCWLLYVVMHKMLNMLLNNSQGC